MNIIPYENGNPEKFKEFSNIFIYFTGGISYGEI